MHKHYLTTALLLLTVYLTGCVSSVTALLNLALEACPLGAGVMKRWKSAFGGPSGSATEPGKNSIHNI